MRDDDGIDPRDARAAYLALLAFGGACAVVAIALVIALLCGA